MRRLLVWVLAVGCLACAELPDVPAGVCGNGVVEDGEDCDSLDASCGAPESDAACRQLCATDDECGSGAARCGFDGVCRSASGGFDLVNEIGTPGAQYADAADFDGDGVSDVMTFGSQQVRALFLEESGGLISESTLPAMALAPAIGDLTTDPEGQPDGLGDIVDLTTRGVSVFRGQPDQSFQSTSYSSISVDKDTVTYAVVEARQPTNQQDRVFASNEVLRFIGNTVQHELDNEPLFDLPFPASELNLPVAVADIDIQDGRESGELAISQKDGNLVHVLAVAQPGANAWNKNAGLHPTVKLPPGAKIKGRLFLQDVNGDSIVDILATAETVAEPKKPAVKVLGIYVSFGVGDGTFHSLASELPTPPAADQEFKLMASPVPMPPLALADLNGDSVIDGVFATAVIVSKLKPGGPDGDCSKKVPGYFCLHNDGPPWIDAAIGDFNATPAKDMALLRLGALNVEFWNGLGKGAFNPFLIPTEGFPARLLKGDFDGDLLPDLAVLERSEPTDPANPTPSLGDDTVSVLFSQAFGPPLAPQVFAELGSVEQLVVGRLDFAAADNVSDIGVLSTDDQGSRAIAIFQGSGSRLLQSPYLLVDTTTDDAELAMRATVGQFGAGGNDIAAVAFKALEPGLEQHLWILPTEEEASISAANVALPIKLPDNFDACSALLLPVDIDANGVNELVMLSRNISEGTVERNNGQAMVFAAKGEPPTFEAVQGPEPVGYRYSAPFARRPTCDPTRGTLLNNSKPLFDALGTGIVQAAELDGQPGADLIALGKENASSLDGLVVYPGTADGKIRFDAPLVLAVPGAKHLVGFTLIQADRDDAPELALITDEGLVIGELDVGAKTVTIAAPIGPLDFTGGFLGKDEPFLPGLGARESRAFALIANDIDRDGVEDLVLGFNGFLRILKGREFR